MDFSGDWASFSLWFVSKNVKVPWLKKNEVEFDMKIDLDGAVNAVQHPKSKIRFCPLFQFTVFSASAGGVGWCSWQPWRPLANSVGRCN